MPLTAVIDYGLCNLRSLVNALDLAGLDWKIVSSGHNLDYKDFSNFILPGVGAFDQAMDHLIERSLDEFVYKLHSYGSFGLGICLGMQLLADSSEESNVGCRGLGLIKGKVIKLSSQDAYVPNIGWSRAVVNSCSNQLSDEASPASRVIKDGDFYFLHSYAFDTDSKQDIASLSSHGGTQFCAAVAKENILGVQYHPEKSQADGIALLRRFSSLS